MKIDITIYDDNDNMMMAYYNEDADTDNLTDCALQLCKVACLEIKDRLRQNETD